MGIEQSVRKERIRNMKVINHYTGNPMINNALMTIKALAGLSNVRDITTDVLRNMIKRLCDELPYSLMSLNLRFKSYTMLFTKNGPLYNDKKMGEKVYEALLYKIVDGFESEGTKQCNITGLRYTKTFTEFMLEAWISLGVPEKEVKKKDLTLNRCWFPLLGGLGSDAQSLPMATQTYNVHPICVVILQFLPFCAYIYKKGILLIDSTALEFCEDFVEEKVRSLIEKVREVAVADGPIENMKGNSRGSYILEALEVMEKCKADCEYADVNLWSFSNSGAGANCSIDRVPNELLKQLSVLRNRHRGELEHILTNPLLSSGFLECLSDKKDWRFLYPAKKYEGVSAGFFESYWNVIGREKQTELAKYISGLVMRYKDSKDDAVLSKTDAYEVRYDYASLLNRILCRATEKKDWSMSCQLAILDNPELLPIPYRCYQMYKLVHFYYQKGVSVSSFPQMDVKDTMASRFCVKMINLINDASDYQKERIIKRIENNDVDHSIFDELLIDYAWEEGIYYLYPLLYATETGEKNVYGLCALLRLYYKNEEDLSSWKDEIDCSAVPVIPDIKRWFDRINEFVCQYVDYRFQSITDETKGMLLYDKIKRSIPRSDLRSQMIWFYSILQRLSENGKEWSEYDLIYDPWDNYAFRTFLFAFRLKLNELSSTNFINNLKTNSYVSADK